MLVSRITECVDAAGIEYVRHPGSHRWPWPRAVHERGDGYGAARPPASSRTHPKRVLKLGDQARAAMALRRLSPRTQETYLTWMRRFWNHHGRRHPSELGSEHVIQFLTHLATHGCVSRSTQDQALAALLCLYRDVLGTPLPRLDDLVRAKKQPRTPIVLTRQEVKLVIEQLQGVPRLMALLLYGSGLRLLECCTLRIKDVDLERHQLSVRRGKGDKDRVTMLPRSLTLELRAHLLEVKRRICLVSRI